MNDYREELMEVFIAESADLLDELRALTQRLTGATGDELGEIYLGLLGATHSLKGIAGAVQNSPAVELAHACEDFCGVALKNKSVKTAFVQQVFDKAIAVMEYTIGQEDVAPGFADILVEMQQLAGNESIECSPSVSQVDTTQASSSTEKADDTDSQEARVTQISNSIVDLDPIQNLQTLRIPLTRLDRMMEQMEEMSAMRTRLSKQFESIDEHVSWLSHPGGSKNDTAPNTNRSELKIIDRDMRIYREQLVQYGYLVDEINATVKQLRMISLSSVLPRWRQIIHDAAHREGKEVRLEVNVGQTEMDKSVLEKVQEAITHLLRNAVAHGIETQNADIEPSTNAIGVVAIEAHSTGSFIRLSITDDGAGIDANEIFRRACNKKMATPADSEVLDEQQKLSFLFLPGFTTIDNANYLRGRGIGLDVVKRTMESLGGNIQVTTEVGVKTTFTMEIPATLMALDGLIIRSGETYCAIPVEFILRTIRIKSSEVMYADGGIAANIKGEPLRLFHLAAFLQQPDPKLEEDQVLTVLHLQQGGREMGLIVETILENSQLVIRSLPWNIKRHPGISGASILADSNVALLLDIMFLFNNSARTLNTAGSKSISEKKKSEGAHILIVDDSITMRALHQNILKSNGYRVSVAEDGAAAWKLLKAGSCDVDLVVSDVQMPVMNGFALTEQIRLHPATATLPVILVTNLNSTSDIRRGLECGASEYIVKSQFDQQKLLDAIERLV